MKRWIKSCNDIFGMSNVRGKHIKVDDNVPFSFYYSPKNSIHVPRVKPVLNPDRINLQKSGTLKLCDDWEFVPGPDDKHVSKSLVENMKQFFRKYLILFLLVWDNHVDDPLLEDYFRGDISFEEFVSNIDFYEGRKDELNQIHSVDSLENYCRSNNLVNFYGN